MDIIEKQIHTTAPAAVIFKIYEDVANWHRWDPDTKAAQLNPGLALGATGSLTPSKGKTVPMEITAFALNRRFTATSKTLLFRLDFEHELTPTENGILILHRVTFSGLLKPLLSRLLGPQIEKGLPVTLQQLKALAEVAHTNNA